MTIRKSVKKDFKGMMTIAKKLHPAWFDNFAINKSLSLDLKIHRGLVAEDKGKIVGFFNLFFK